MNFNFIFNWCISTVKAFFIIVKEWWSIEGFLCMQYVITCTAGKHYSFISFYSCIRGEKKVNKNFSNIFFFGLRKKTLMKSKGVKISLTRDGKINKALHMNWNWLFYSVPLKLWGVMNSILFDYTNQTEENRKLLWSNSVVCYWIDQFSMLQIEWISYHTKKVHYKFKLMNFFSLFLTSSIKM